MDSFASLFTERPYVIAFLCAFLAIATAERGLPRMLFWLASGTFLGWLMEFSSTHNGFPFGSYTYNDQLFPEEIWLGGVPLFASISFAFLTYFGYSVACTLLIGVERHGISLRRPSNPQLEQSIQVLLLAALITTWMDTVMDPVTHLGQYWFLGDLYAYQGHGQHFDVPLTNYAGWFFTALCIVFVNQRFDAFLSARGVAAGGFDLPAKPLWAVGTVMGNFAFIIGITIYLQVTDAVPPSVPIGDILLSGLLIAGAFIVFAALMLVRAFNRESARRGAETLALRPQNLD
jgi:putative membrane protein